MLFIFSHNILLFPQNIGLIFQLAFIKKLLVVNTIIIYRAYHMLKLLFLLFRSYFIQCLYLFLVYNFFQQLNFMNLSVLSRNHIFAKQVYHFSCFRLIQIKLFYFLKSKENYKK